VEKSFAEIVAHYNDIAAKQGDRYAMSIMVDKVNLLLHFIDRWRDIIQGGDSIEALEGWAREFVEEANEKLNLTL
jgi:deoxyhypusine synthase